MKHQQPCGPHAYRNTARQVVDDQNSEGSGQQRPKNDPCNNQHNPQCANYWAPLTRKRHQREHRLQRPTERSDPTQHAKGRTGDCPGSRKETATRRNVTQGGGGQLFVGGWFVCGVAALLRTTAQGPSLFPGAFLSVGKGGRRPSSVTPPPHPTPPHPTPPHPTPPHPTPPHPTPPHPTPPHPTPLGLWVGGWVRQNPGKANVGAPVSRSNFLHRTQTGRQTTDG